MTNNQLNWNEGGRRNAQTSQGIPSPTSESTEVTVSVEDIKMFFFTYDKKMLDNYIVSSERFLHFPGSKFGPSKQLSLKGGRTVVHNAVQPREIETK